MKIVITGGSGMVGRNIREHHRAHDYEILSPSRKELDLLDEDAVKAFFHRTRPDLVIHAAGTVGGIQANIAAPVRFLTDNLRMGLNVIMGARSAEVRNLLNIGSSCMYPCNAENPLREETILSGELEPTNEGYAIAKLACARLCSYIHSEDSGFLYKTIIPCNLYGRHDKFDPEKSHMIPAVIRKIADAVESGSEIVSIWGDGKTRREFMYAGDLADFVFFATDRFSELPQYLNVGIGRDYTINEYYSEIAEVLGFTGSFSHDLSKPSGMSQKLVDINRLDKFGWHVKTQLRDGISLTYNFYKGEAGK
ncbi:GDP-L-fucose synthase family protein [Pararhizobium antarcticum]|uniref:GDP-L-fucose synthase n=1 Tax=Pararhizobium antarcticum TaxID=1798805 RepID=A0A657LLM1_9HYPH|nr:GDP-L-fucose synthase [Pararhizobium antarcticum]OJF89685.1 GDP-fucose synthetase [Rhizobium sp. 58]OJF90108.1 GDP-fucose synthetase [Pararhizobium antarcticum]